MKMTVYYRSACLAALLCFILPAAAQPNTAPAARHEIQAAYKKIDAALAQKDIDTALDFNADDCEFYDRKGRLMGDGGGRQELVDLVDKVDTIRRTTKILSFAGTSSEATVTVKCHTVAGVSSSITGRAAKGISDDVFRDYWVKTDDGWRRKRTRILQSKAALRKNF